MPLISSTLHYKLTLPRFWAVASGLPINRPEWKGASAMLELQLGNQS